MYPSTSRQRLRQVKDQDVEAGLAPTLETGLTSLLRPCSQETHTTEAVCCQLQHLSLHWPRTMATSAALNAAASIERSTLTYKLLLLYCNTLA